MNIYEKLMNIQVELKAPKNQRNTFGNYNYRSCEDILEGLKPLLLENRTTLVLDDEVVQIGDRYYVKATATLIDIDQEEGMIKTKNSHITSIAYAREDEVKKGMDLAQITGSVSSYARKYALNGLFAIDDTKDSDSTNKHGKDKGNDKVAESSNESAGTDNFKCSDCNADVNQAVNTFSVNKFGKTLCFNCQKKVK